MQEMQDQLLPQNWVNILPPPSEEQHPLAPGAKEENVDIVGGNAGMAQSSAPEIDFHAYENLDGFDMEMEKNLGGVQMEPNQFAWANANADGVDPEGHGPVG